MTTHPSVGRFDIYRLIHKGLRAFMADTLLAVGSMDPEDDADVAATLARVRDLMVFCRSHLEHENTFLHSAMEARRPGSAAATSADHEDHVRSLDELTDLANAVERARGAERAARAHLLYGRLGVFVGENLVHMNVEETHNNAVLWDAYSDDELLAIEHAIVSTLDPEEQGATLRWIVPSINPAERAGFLSGMRRAAPAEVFEAVMASIRPHLSPKDFDKLARALAAESKAAA